MSVATANPSTRTPAVRPRHATADHGRKPGHPRLWALVEALAYTGALFDPTGVLAAQRCANVHQAER